MIKVGDALPEAKLTIAGAEGPSETTVAAVFGGKRVVLFAVPGAFTPTCTAKHLPGYLQHAAEFGEKGVDLLACIAVNDPFVLRAWAKSEGVEERVTMLADGAAAFTRTLGLELDLSKRGLGIRSQRYAMIVDDGVVTSLSVEKPGDFSVSGAEAVLAQL